MLVKAYKAGKSIRVTVPKAIYDQFAEVSKNLAARKSPCLVKYARLITRHGEEEPYFSNCDFGLALYIGPPSLQYLSSSVCQYGKTSFGFSLSPIGSTLLGVVTGTSLECEILENTRPEEGFYHQIIGYRKLSSANDRIDNLRLQRNAKLTTQEVDDESRIVWPAS